MQTPTVDSPKHQGSQIEFGETGELASLLLDTEKYAENPNSHEAAWIKLHFRKVFALPVRYRFAHQRILTDRGRMTAEDFADMGRGFNPHEAPFTIAELSEVLGLTIKKDYANKLITFLGELSAYTDDSQINISNNAPSSTGKSYIPTEEAKYFPEEDVIEVGYCSPTAFFHDHGIFDKEKGGYTVDLAHKILIFLDQPHTLLLQHLRPLLSHDKKRLKLKITDKSQKAGLRTKTITIIGFPAVIFCTAGLKIDEQEATRFILLSPETSQEKIREAIIERLSKEADSEVYRSNLDNDPRRHLLRKRILAIKREAIRSIRIGPRTLLEKEFFTRNPHLKPRHQRDIARIASLVKSLALLNLWYRPRNGSTITATEEDVVEAFKLWDSIADSQELNLPPYIYSLYREIIVAAYHDKNKAECGAPIGLTRQDIIKKHLSVYGRPLADWNFKQELLPMLEAAGLISQEPDPTDKRRMLVYPTALLHISSGSQNDQKYIESDGRVNVIGNGDNAQTEFGGIGQP